MRRLNSLVVSVLAVVASAVPAAVLWILVAQPSTWRETGDGLVLTESAAGHQFGVIAWFVAMGVVVGSLGGWWVERRHGELGPMVVAALVLASLLAAVLMAWIGLQFGPADPGTVTGLVVGDTVPMQLDLGSVAPWLAWPFGAVSAFFVSAYRRPTADVWV